MAGPDPPEPPDATFVKRRWIAHHWADWARQCDQMIREYGAVTGSIRYEKRHQARWQARHLMNLLDDLGIRPRYQLREHVDRQGGGYRWTVEHVPPGRY
jgi:hypothetical protein